MKSLKREIKDFIDFGFTPRERRLNTYLENIIAEKTGFKARDIEVNIAEKLDMKLYNEFNYFEFTYHHKDYILKKDLLQEI